LGCHRKKSPIRISRRLPGIAVPALAGVAAAFCLAPQALADPSAAQGTAHHAVVADTASRLDPWSAQLLSAIKQTEQTAQTDQVAQQQAGSGQPSWYTVKAGDSLSGIAERSYHNQNAWPVLYWANRSRIHWANVIEAGQMLRIPVEPARIPNPPALLGPAPVPVAETAVPQATPASATAQGAADVSSSAASGGSFAQCVIARESGGQAQVMNATGHYGLYQFSASTWAAYGGSAADFGHASASEQNQVFDNAIASGGQSNWSAYDGC
jgi:LysM repeat protein